MSDNNKSQGGSLGMVACVAILVGGMIGSAIFSLSGMTMYYAGPASILSWAIAAVVMGMYGMQIAELSTIYPRSGGVFVFPAKALGKTEKQGRVWGFLSAWGYIISNIIAVAFSAIYVATYMGVGFPTIFGDAEGVHTKQILFAVIAVLICMALNLIKITDAGKFNNVLVGGLVITMLVYIVVAFTSGQWDAKLFVPVFTQGAQGPAGFLSAIPTAMVGYGSCVAIAFMVSEVKNPNRTVPKSLIISLIIVVALYLLVIVSTLGLITAQMLIDTPFFRFIPLFAAAFTKLTAIPWLSQLISISALLALITTMLVVLALNARAMAAVAEDGLLPKVFAKQNRNNVPATATIVTAGIAIVLCFFPGLTEILVNMGALFAAITIAINCVSLLQARKKHTRIDGEYRAPGGSIMPIVTLIILVICYIPGILTGGGGLWIFTIVSYAIGLAIMLVMMKLNDKADAPKA
ncbi:MAG: APC family permease [Ruthenibacterium sp.]